jgi:hypothetical protein
MDNRYDPEYLMVRFALQYESQGQSIVPIGSGDSRPTQIQIFRKDTRAPAFLIVKDSDRPDAAAFLLSGGRLLKNEALEEEKDSLGKVTASYKGRTSVTFNTYQEFLKWLGIA